MDDYPVTSQADADAGATQAPPATSSPDLPPRSHLPEVARESVTFAEVLQLHSSAASMKSHTRLDASTAPDLGFLSLEMESEWETVTRRSGRKAKRKP